MNPLRFGLISPFCSISYIVSSTYAPDQPWDPLLCSTSQCSELFSTLGVLVSLVFVGACLCLYPPLLAVNEFPCQLFCTEQSCHHRSGHRPQGYFPPPDSNCLTSPWSLRRRHCQRTTPKNTTQSTRVRYSMIGIKHLPK